jgi:hypothetical protein
MHECSAFLCSMTTCMCTHMPCSQMQLLGSAPCMHIRYTNPLHARPNDEIMRNRSFEQPHAQATRVSVMESPFAKAGLCLGPADQHDGISVAERYTAAQPSSALQSGRLSKITLSSSVMQMFMQQRASQSESDSSSPSPDAAGPKIIDVTALCSTGVPISSRAPPVPQKLENSRPTARPHPLQARSGSLHRSPSPCDLPLSRQKRGDSQQLMRWPAGMLRGLICASNEAPTAIACKHSNPMR